MTYLLADCIQHNINREGSPQVVSFPHLHQPVQLPKNKQEAFFKCLCCLFIYSIQLAWAVVIHSHAQHQGYSCPRKTKPRVIIKDLLIQEMKLSQQLWESLFFSKTSPVFQPKNQNSYDGVTKQLEWMHLVFEVNLQVFPQQKKKLTEI